MSRKYTKVEQVAEIVRERKAKGETYREIADSLGLERAQVRELMKRERKKERKVAAGYILRPKGRPRKVEISEETRRNKEIAELRMTVDVLRNFLSEAGRR